MNRPAKPIVCACVTCAFSFLLLSATAVAESTIRYNYLEARYVDVEESDVDGDGFSFGGSYLLNKDIYLRGDYQDVDLDGSADAQILELGIGYRYAYQNMDLIGEINYVDLDGDVIETDSGVLLSAGLRTYLLPKLEARASFNYVTVNDNDTYVQLGADYFLTGKLSLGGTVRLGADVDEFTLGARWYY